MLGALQHTVLLTPRCRWSICCGKVDWCRLSTPGYGEWWCKKSNVSAERVCMTDLSIKARAEQEILHELRSIQDDLQQRLEAAMAWWRVQLLHHDVAPLHQPVIKRDTVKITESICCCCCCCCCLLLLLLLLAAGCCLFVAGCCCTCVE